MRQKYGRSIDIDTFHAATGYGEDFVHVAMAFAPYTLVVVDEMSQLDEAQFRHLNALWDAVDHVPTLALIGDRYQMSGYGDRRPWDSPLWKVATKVTSLKKAFRCKDAAYAKLLHALRTAKPAATCNPDVVAVPDIMRGRRAWTGNAPTVADVRRILIRHPNTTFLAVTRAGAALINDLAVQAKYPRRRPIAVVEGDVEANPENYVRGVLKPLRELVAMELCIHAGMQVYLTKNVDKAVDYVNGMLCTVESWDAAARAVRVITATGHRVAVWPWTDPDKGNMTYYPMRPGYASTVLKFQGAELEHVTLFLDARHVPGAAYTAMSRVAYGDCCLIGGRERLEKDHFTPAR